MNVSKQDNTVPTAEDIREALGFKRDDERVKVTLIPASGLADALRSGRGLDVEDTIKQHMETLGVMTEGKSTIVQSEIPHVGDCPTDEDILAEQESGAFEDLNDVPEPVHEVLREVVAELEHAMTKHPEPFHSPHEGYAILHEEADELWEHIKRDQGRTGMARDEAVQIAAMALRYLIDIDPRYPHGA